MDVGNLVKKNRVPKLLDWLSWKFKLYNSYAKENFRDVNIKFLFREFINKEQRKKNYYDYNKQVLDIFGKKIGLTLAEGTSISSFNETFLDRNYSLFEDFLPREGETVIDIGSQHGDYALLCSNTYHCKKVIALEPVHDNYEILVSNITNNGVNRTIMPLELAASDKDGNIEFFKDGDMAKSNGNGEKISCKSVKLDSLGIDEVDLLKIDVEGGEVSVIRGAIETLSKFRPNLIIETHSKLLRKNVEELLIAIGYRLVHEGRTIIIDEPGMDVVQNLFYSFDKRNGIR
jgi:FkbM family methyltransferase